MLLEQDRPSLRRLTLLDRTIRRHATWAGAAFVALYAANLVRSGARVTPDDRTAMYVVVAVAIVGLVIIAGKARRRYAQLLALATDGVVVRARRVSEDLRYDSSGYKHRTATYHYLVRREERTFQQRSDFNPRALTLLVEPSTGSTYVIGPSEPRMYSAFVYVETLRWVLRGGGLVYAAYLGLGTVPPNLSTLYTAMVVVAFAIATGDFILDRILRRMEEAAEDVF